MTFIYCLFIFFLSSLEGGKVEEPPAMSDVVILKDSFDKIEHFGLYFGLGCLAYLSFRKSLPFSSCLNSTIDHLGISLPGLPGSGTADTRSRTLRGLVIITFLFTALYGLSDEAHQLFVPGRSATFLDLFVDAAGGFTAAIFMNWAIEKRKRDARGL